MDLINLQSEAGYFCQALFGPTTVVPKEVGERYAQACNFCFPKSDPNFQAKVNLIVAHRLDVEAIELALRHRQPDNTPASMRRCPQL